MPTQNVVAVWEGSDPVLKDEYVALGAHYDHVGSGCPPVGTDTICNGADDDGSGTTAFLAWPKHWRKRRRVRNVQFCLSGIVARRKGCGVRVISLEYPTVPLNQIVAQINIDMIGRSKKEGDTNPRNKDLTGPDAFI